MGSDKGSFSPETTKKAEKYSSILFSCFRGMPKECMCEAGYPPPAAEPPPRPPTTVNRIISSNRRKLSLSLLFLFSLLLLVCQRWCSLSVIISCGVVGCSTAVLRNQSWGRRRQAGIQASFSVRTHARFGAACLPKPPPRVTLGHVGRRRFVSNVGNCFFLCSSLCA